MFTWPQGDDGDDGGPLNAIAAAAERTQREPGGRATIRALVSSPQRSEPFTMTGETVYNDEAGRSRSVMTMPNPESGDPVKMQMVTDGVVIYMRSSLFGSLPDGREWMAFDFSFVEELGMQMPTDGDAKGELELLEAATGDVQKLGREEVRGLPTTRYRGTVSVSENAEMRREEGAEEIASFIEEKGAPLRVEAWIDADGLVRRMRFITSQPETAGEGVTTTDLRMDFYDFSLVPEIEVPESSEVFDVTDMAQESLGLTNDN